MSEPLCASVIARTEQSPAVQFLLLTKRSLFQCGVEWQKDKAVRAMHEAYRLAITGGMRFEEDDLIYLHGANGRDEAKQRIELMKEDIHDAILRILNEAAAADPEAMHALVSHRVPCSQGLIDHPTIKIGPSRPDGPCEVGMLGVLNGICEVITGRLVAAVVEDGEKKVRKFISPT